MKGKRKKNRTNKSFPRRQIKKPSKKKIQAPHWSSAANQKSRSLFSFFFAHEIFEEAEKRRLGRKITKKINERERERERERESHEPSATCVECSFFLFSSLFFPLLKISLWPRALFSPPPPKKNKTNRSSHENLSHLHLFVVVFFWRLFSRVPIDLSSCYFVVVVVFFIAGPLIWNFGGKMGKTKIKNRNKKKSGHGLRTEVSETNNNSSNDGNNSSNNKAVEVFYFPFFR